MKSYADIISSDVGTQHVIDYNSINKLEKDKRMSNRNDLAKHAEENDSSLITY